MKEKYLWENFGLLIYINLWDLWGFEDPDAYSMLYNRKKEKFLNSKQIYSYECYTFYALENFFSI